MLLTSDHGEQLGDHGLMNKLGYFEESYKVPGIVRAPGLAGAHGSVVEAFTENIDFFPTICEALGIEIPAQCDGLPLTGFLEGRLPPWWRVGGGMGVRLAIPGPSRRRLRLAVGQAPGTGQPRRAPFRGRGLRPVRRRILASATTSAPTRPGGQRSRTRPASSLTHSRCSPGGRSTRTVKSRTSFSKTAASGVGQQGRSSHRRIDWADLGSRIVATLPVACRRAIVSTSLTKSEAGPAS